MASTHQHLSQLESAGLVRRFPGEPELEYLFKHALVQDATYASILKQDRRSLHAAVGRVLEQLHADRLDEVAAVLGLHFDEAHDDTLAIRYLTLAGDVAAGRHALEVAIRHYSRALLVAERSGAARAALLRGRGHARDLLGAFEPARADYEQAIQVAQAEHDRRTEWHACLDLGLLWASRDYARTGEYLRAAYALAEAAGDPGMRAYSLNRIGNWYMNSGQPKVAKRHHLEALSIFEILNDPPGLAATADLLGMTHAILGEFTESQRHYLAAVEHFEALGDKAGLTSSLSMLAWMSAMIGGEAGHGRAACEEALAFGSRSVQVASAMGWRAGEAFALFANGVVHMVAGYTDSARQQMEAGLRLAESIGHRQWTLASHYGLGHLYYELLNLPRAREYYERALAMATEINSLHWRNQVSGPLALLLIELGEVGRAESVLAAVDGCNAPAGDVNRNNLVHACAELRLRQGDPARALALAQTLLADRHKLLALGPNNPMRMSELGAQALLALGRHDEAVALLREALAYARQRDVGLWVWRAHVYLAQCLRAQGQPQQAQSEEAQARHLAETRAAAIADESLRQHFLRAALREGGL